MKDALRALRFIYSYPFRYRATMVAATALMLIGTLGAIAVPIFMAIAINIGVLSGESRILLGLALGVLAVGLCTTAVAHLGKRLRFTVASKAVNDLRYDLFGRLLRLGPADIADASGGRALNRLVSDAIAVRGITNGGLPEFFNQALLTVATLIAALLIDWRTTLFAITPILVVTVANLPVQLRFQRIFAEVKEHSTRLMASVGESLANIKLVKSSGQETEAAERLDKINRVHTAQRGRMERRRGRWSGVLNIMGALAVPIALVAGGQSVVSGRVSVGGLVALIALIMLFQMGMQMVVMHVNTAFQNVVIARRLLQVMAAPPAITERSAARPMPSLPGALAAENLVVEVAGRRVLDGVNLVIEAGDSVAILGATGSGKTTLLHTLARLRDPRSGAVTYDGIDANAFTLASIRRHVICLPQRQWIFEGTLAENVLFARPDATPAEVEAAVAAAALGHIPLSRTFSATTMDLSAGERQRIGLARSLLADPQVLLLDDPTANLDAETQAEFLRTLFRVRGSRTLVIATHQLAVADFADRVITLADGVIELPAAEPLESPSALGKA